MTPEEIEKKARDLAVRLTARGSLAADPEDELRALRACGYDFDEAAKKACSWCELGMELHRNDTGTHFSHTVEMADGYCVGDHCFATLIHALKDSLVAETASI